MGDKLIEITEQDLKFIVDDYYAVILDTAKFNSFCRNCSNRNETEMINFKIHLNQLNDLVFKGECKYCNDELRRYIEIGENKKYLLKSLHIKGKREN